jgi:hypothetical protein
VDHYPINHRDYPICITSHKWSDNYQQQTTFKVIHNSTFPTIILKWPAPVSHRRNDFRRDTSPLAHSSQLQPHNPHWTHPTREIHSDKIRSERGRATKKSSIPDDITHFFFFFLKALGFATVRARYHGCKRHLREPEFIVVTSLGIAEA